MFLGRTQTRVEAIRIAQAHYPERLGLGVVAHPPLLFWALWSSLKPFIDPVTKCAAFLALHPALRDARCLAVLSLFIIGLIISCAHAVLSSLPTDCLVCAIWDTAGGQALLH